MKSLLKYTQMSLVKFKRDNLLKYEAVRIESSPISETIGFIKLEQGEPMGGIESELDAIEKTDYLKAYHAMNGIKKSPRYYYYFKLQAMALNDSGYKKTKQHIFKDSEGRDINIILN